MDGFDRMMRERRGAGRQRELRHPGEQSAHRAGYVSTPAVCRWCGGERLTSRALVVLLDLLPRKDAGPRRKAARLIAAQLAGYCSAKCRRQAEENE